MCKGQLGNEQFHLRLATNPPAEGSKSETTIWTDPDRLNKTGQQKIGKQFPGKRPGKIRISASFGWQAQNLGSTTWKRWSVNNWICGVMVWGIFYFGTFSTLPADHCLNTTVFMSFVVDHVHFFMTTGCTPSDGCFQLDNVPCHKYQIISNWFTDDDNALYWNALHRHRLNWIEHLWGCGGMGYPHHWCLVSKSATFWCYQNGLKSIWEMFPVSFWIYDMKRFFWRQSGLQPCTSTVDLIKWVYILNSMLSLIFV